MRNVLRSVAVVGVLVLGACYEGVGPGYAGVKVNQYGTERGVERLPLQVGRVWYNPVTTSVYKFPTFQQNVLWTAEDTDQSVTVNSQEGALLNFDVSAGIQFERDSVPAIFQRFRNDQGAILETFIRPMVRKAFSDEASKLPAAEFLGAEKVRVQERVLASVRSQLAPIGIVLVSVEIMGEVRVDETVKSSINAVLTASQRALEAQNKVVQAEAEAKQLIAKARGDSLSAVIRAAGEYEANRLLQTSLTPAVRQQRTLDRWHGVLPQVTGGATPFLNLPKP